MLGIIGALIGLALIFALSYLVTTGIAWVILYLLGLVGVVISGSVWIWGAILWVVYYLIKSATKQD